MMDKIIIKGLKIYAFHGVNQEEKDEGQNFIIDAVLYVDLKQAGYTDVVNDTVSYAKVTKSIIKVVKERSYNLLERVAHMITQQLFAEFVDIEKIDITVKKPEAPIKAEFDYMAVNICRDRNEICDRSST